MNKSVVVCVLRSQGSTLRALLACGRCKAFDVDIIPVDEEICTAIIPAGLLSKLNWDWTRCPNGFLLGRLRKFQHRETDPETAIPLVISKTHPLHTKGVYLTPYSHLDVAHHLGTRTLAETTGKHHIQMADRGDPAVNAIRAYQGEIRNRAHVNPPLLVYKVLDAPPTSLI